jgi:hypothetical protein
MNKYDHLPLPVYKSESKRKTRGGGGGYSILDGRQKDNYSNETSIKANKVVESFDIIKKKFQDIVNPSLIFELEINQSVDFNAVEKILTPMGIHIISSAENKKGYWVVFSDDEKLIEFKHKLNEYGSPTGHNYDFFNAFGNLQEIPIDEKIGENLKKNPLTDTPEFIDIELWRMTDGNKNIVFINELKEAYSNNNKFRITDQLITKSFVLLRVMLSNTTFEEIIALKEIARADRPYLPTFNSYTLENIDISTIETNAPDENAAGILIVDSGILSNHPLLEKCVGAEENFQTKERALQDTVGHGSAVAGCVAYGDIEKCIIEKNFSPSNWIFSAKVMYSEDLFNGEKIAVYDPEKLVEHQLKDAVESFLSHENYHIRVVNISLGNTNEVWQKDYTRQLPLASLIDELAYTYPNVLFIVSAGNNNPLNSYNTVDSIKNNYPRYLKDNFDFKIINPATSALAITVGSIAQPIRINPDDFWEDKIKTPIAKENQPSPFTRVGPGINGMVKPELVEYGGNLILYNNYGRISEDICGKLLLINNDAINRLVKYDYGTSFSAPKIANAAGQLANKYPHMSANFIKNLLLAGAQFPFTPDNDFYDSKPGKTINDHINVCGYGLPSLERSINSFDNRVVLFDEGNLQLNKVKVYSLKLPNIFFTEKGRKRISVTLTFTPEVRATRGDSYLGNHMEFHLFHSINPQILIDNYAILQGEDDEQNMPESIKKCKIKLLPGANTRKAGCHQKAWKDYKQKPRNWPEAPISLVLINYNKWMPYEDVKTDYCLSVTFEHEKEIDLYNQIRATIQTRVKV